MEQTVHQGGQKLCHKARRSFLADCFGFYVWGLVTVIFNDELWLNPGTESDEVLTAAEGLGLNVIQACSIIGAGVSPATL